MWFTHFNVLDSYFFWLRRKQTQEIVYDAVQMKKNIDFNRIWWSKIDLDINQIKMFSEKILMPLQGIWKTQLIDKYTFHKKNNDVTEPQLHYTTTFRTRVFKINGSLVLSWSEDCISNSIPIYPLKRVSIVNSILTHWVFQSKLLM